MAEPQTILGTGTIYQVATAEPATYDETGFDGLTWLEVVDVVNIGAGGGTAAVQEYVPLKTGEAVRISGAITYADRAVQAGKHRNNAAHMVLASYFNGANKGKVLSHRIVYPGGETESFTGTVSGFAGDTLEANTFIFDTITITPNRPSVDGVGVTGHTLTYAAGSNGSIIGTAIQRVVDAGSGTAVFASPDAGYEFDGWSDGSNANPRTDTNVTADVSVTASFIPE